MKRDERLPGSELPAEFNSMALGLKRWTLIPFSSYPDVMKRPLAFFAASFLSCQVHGIFKNCELSLHQSFRYLSGEHPAHEYSLPLGKVIVGGVGEKSPPNIDHLAIQRAIGSCAPGILKCLKESKTKAPLQMTISFRLQPMGEVASGSHFQVLLQGKESQIDRKCIEKLLPESQFGLILKNPVEISMPVKIQALH